MLNNVFDKPLFNIMFSCNFSLNLKKKYRVKTFFIDYKYFGLNTNIILLNTNNFS